jgi:hypothetical protein
VASWGDARWQLLPLTAVLAEKAQQELRKSADEAVVIDSQAVSLLEALISLSKNKRNERTESLISVYPNKLNSIHAHFSCSSNQAKNPFM